MYAAINNIRTFRATRSTWVSLARIQIPLLSSAEDALSALPYAKQRGGEREREKKETDSCETSFVSLVAAAARSRESACDARAV